MRLKMTKMTKNPNIIVGHFICQSAALEGEIQPNSVPLAYKSVYKSLQIYVCVVTKSQRYQKNKGSKKSPKMKSSKLPQLGPATTTKLGRISSLPNEGLRLHKLRVGERPTANELFGD